MELSYRKRFKAPKELGDIYYDRIIGCYSIVICIEDSGKSLLKRYYRVAPVAQHRLHTMMSYNKRMLIDELNDILDEIGVDKEDVLRAINKGLILSYTA